MSPADSSDGTSDERTRDTQTGRRLSLPQSGTESMRRDEDYDDDDDLRDYDLITHPMSRAGKICFRFDSRWNLVYTMHLNKG